jgi:ACS family tartrate transporter-like MFS transporter
MFLMEGIPAIVLGMVAWILLPNGPSEARWLGEKEKSWLRVKLALPPRVGAERPEEAKRRPWYLSSVLWRFGLVYFGLNTCTYGISLWLPSALKTLSGLPNLLLGMTSAVPYALAAVVMVIVGMHSDKTGERRMHIAVSAIAGAVALVIAGVSPGLLVSVAAFGVALAASSAMTGPFWAMASGLSAESSAAPAIALVNSIGNLGSGFGPYWIGYLRDATQGFRAGLWSVAGMMGLAAVVVMTIARDGKAKG